MKNPMFVIAAALFLALGACHRPDPGQLTPDQRAVYKGQ